MAVILQEGLKGLSGLPSILDLKEEELEEWYNKYPKANNRGFEANNRVYRNLKYIEKYGMLQFRSKTAEERDKLYSDDIIIELFQKRYLDDQTDFYNGNDMIMFPEAMHYLLENLYKTSKERELELQRNIKTTAKSQVDNPYTDAIFAGFEFKAVESNSKSDSRKHSDILDKAFELDNNILKNKKEVQEAKESIKNNMLQNLQNEGSDGIVKRFHDLLNTRDPETNVPLFSYYQAYKDEHLIADISEYQMIDFLSEYDAIINMANNASSEELANALYHKALSILSDNIQHAVYENTTVGDKLKNLGNNIATKFCSSLGQTCTGVYSLGLYFTDRDAYNHFIMGLNKDGSDIEGWFNPQFLSGMDLYGVWTVADYNAVLNNGGVSSKLIIRDVGDEYEFWNTATLYDSMGLLGYAASSIGLDYLLTGGAGAALKGAGKQSLKMLLRAGVNPRTLVKTRNFVDNPVTDFMTDMVRIGLHSTGEATLEGVGVASEVYYDALKKYSEYFDLPDMVAKREALVLERMLQEFPEGYQDSFVTHDGALISKKFLREQQIRQEVAKQMYDEGLEQAEEYALKAAGAAYATQATIMGVKNSIGDALVTSYTFAKPFKTKIRLRNTVDVDKTTVKADGTLEAKDFTWKNFAKTSAKVFAEGATEEFTDNMTHTGAVDLGLNYYNNYLQHLYNGEDIATANLMEGATISYLTGAEKSFYDEGAYFEAMLGAISPVTNSVINVATPFKFASKNYRDKFSKMSALEKTNEFFLYNPLIKEAMNEKLSYEANKQVVDAVNKVISEHGQDFKDIAASMNFVREFNEMRSLAEVVDAKDSKFNLAFQFLLNLNTLAQAGSQSPLYNKYLQMLTDASEGKISLEMLAQYFSMPENKILLQETNKEQAHKEAAELIQKNSKQLIDLYKEYQQTFKAISDFSNNTLDKETINQLTYQTMLSKNWENRVKEMEKVLTGRSNVSTSNTQTGQMSIAGIKSIISELTGKENAINLVTGRKPKGRLKRMLKNSKKISDVYRNMLKNNELGDVLSADEILVLNPEERNRMLSHHDLYTEEQIAEIEKAENILAQRDPDYRSKVKDIAILHSRILQNNESYRNLLDNPQRLLSYKSTLLLQAVHDAVITKNRIMVHDMLSRLDKAYTAKDGSFINEAKNLSSSSLKTVIDARPEYADIIKPLMERATVMETLNSIVDGLEVQFAQKTTLKNALVNITDNATNEQEVIDSIEDFIDNSDIELTLREQLNEILDLAKDRKLTRNAVKVEKRGDKLARERKIRDTKDKRNRKAREKRAQAKAKREAGKLTKLQNNEELKNLEPPKQVTTPPQNTPEVNEDIKFNAETGEAMSPKISGEGLVEVKNAEPVTNEGEEIPTTLEAIQLRGNVFSPYVVGKLSPEGDVVEEGLHTGKISPTIPRGNWLKAFFEWMKNAGINYQDIIDFELAKIAELNPSVHFLMANPNIESTNDKVLVKTPLLVVEVTDDIRKIHKQERGGILRAEGKEWLVIGTLGYLAGTSEEAAWNELMKPLMGRRNDFFKNNPQERFTVDTKYSTTIKQIALGNLIRLLEGEAVLDRSIQELLDDPKRNPFGLKWKDLAFGLLTDSDFNLSRNLEGTVYVPNRALENSGNIFIMVPSSNGKYIPVAIKPAYLSDLKTSEFKDTLYNLCMLLTSSNYLDRVDAIRQLCLLLNFNDDNNILIGTEQLNKLTIKENGIEVQKFDLSAPDLDRQKVFNAIINSRFRIQITNNNLLDVDKMKELDAAGVLQTDIAVLGTMGSHFTVNMTDLKTGKPIELQPQGTPESGIIRGNSIRTTGERSQLLNGRRVIKHNGIWRDEFDNPITDSNTLKLIEYLNTIEDHTIAPAYKDATGNDVYIISNAESNPVVVKVSLSHKVLILEGNDAAPVLNFVEEQKRKEAAKNSKYSDINTWLGEGSSTLEASNLVLEPQSINKKETNTQEKTNKTETFSEVKREKTLKDLQMSENLLTFESVLTDPKIGDRVLDELEVIFKEKGWGEMPDSFAETASALKSHNIPVPTSLDKIDSWLELIKKCR